MAEASALPGSDDETDGARDTYIQSAYKTGDMGMLIQHGHLPLPVRRNCRAIHINSNTAHRRSIDDDLENGVS